MRRYHRLYEPHARKKNPRRRVIGLRQKEDRMQRMVEKIGEDVFKDLPRYTASRKKMTAKDIERAIRAKMEEEKKDVEREERVRRERERDFGRKKRKGVPTGIRVEMKNFPGITYMLLSPGESATIRTLQGDQEYGSYDSWWWIAFNINDDEIGQGTGVDKSTVLAQMQRSVESYAKTLLTEYMKQYGADAFTAKFSKFTREEPMPLVGQSVNIDPADPKYAEEGVQILVTAEPDFEIVRGKKVGSGVTFAVQAMTKDGKFKSPTYRFDEETYGRRAAYERAKTRGQVLAGMLSGVDEVISNPGHRPAMYRNAAKMFKMPVSNPDDAEAMLERVTSRIDRMVGVPAQPGDAFIAGVGQGVLLGIELCGVSPKKTMTRQKIRRRAQKKMAEAQLDLARRALEGEGQAGTVSQYSGVDFGDRD